MTQRMKGYVPCIASISLEIYQWIGYWYTDKGKIRQHFQGYFRSSFVR